MPRNKQESDEQLMKRLFRLVPKLPKDSEKRLCQNELSSTCYLFTFRSNGQRYGYCTECKKTVSLEPKRSETYEESQNRQKKHNEVGFCPECKARVTFKDRGRSKNKLWNYAHFIIAQKAGKMLVLRFFDVTRSWRHFDLERITKDFGDGELEFHEEHRLFLDPANRKAYQFTRQWEYYGNSYYAKFYGYEAGDGELKTDWYKRQRFRTDFSRYGFCNIYGLDDNLLKKTGFRYCPIDLYEKVSGEYKDIIKFMLKYTLYPNAVEYMMKCGFPELFSLLIKHHELSILNLRAKTPEKLMRLPKSEITKMRKGVYGEVKEMTPSSLRYIQALQKYGFTDSEKLRLFKTVSPYKFEEYRQYILKYTTVTKAENYIKKHAKGSLLPTTEYIDYIKACERLGWDLSRHEILFPNDLSEAHDRANALIRAEEERQRAEKARKYKEDRLLREKDIDLKIRKLYPMLSKQWEFRSNGLLIRPAKDLEEIIREGEIQGICVGSEFQGYTKRHAQGTAFIFFVRRESDPDTPVCTVEISSDGAVVQCRGYRNRAPSEEVKSFMEKFKSYICGTLEVSA